MSARLLAASLFAGCVAVAMLPALAAGAPADSTAVDDSLGTVEARVDSTAAVAPSPAANGRTYLVPELEGAGYRVSRDPQRFKHRISFSPAVGRLGEDNLFAFRAAYSPNAWLAYEISLGHDPATSLHALLHTFNILLRYPLPGRAQPYMTMGYGMMTVYPGKAINADSVTKNTLTLGGGLELYIRDDVALRGEVRGATVLGQELNSEGTVAYGYREYTLGFAFYRKLGG